MSSFFFQPMNNYLFFKVETIEKSGLFSNDGGTIVNILNPNHSQNKLYLIEELQFFTYSGQIVKFGGTIGFVYGFFKLINSLFLNRDF